MDTDFTNTKNAIKQSKLQTELNFDEVVAEGHSQHSLSVSRSSLVHSTETTLKNCF